MDDARFMEMWNRRPSADLDAYLGSVPTTKSEFWALAQRDRKAIEEGGRFMACLDLVPDTYNRFEDIEFERQVRRLWSRYRYCREMVCRDRAGRKALPKDKRRDASGAEPSSK